MVIKEDYLKFKVNEITRLYGICVGGVNEQRNSKELC